MKLSFYWDSTSGVMAPCCSSDSLNKDGVSPLSCLLMDDGGQGYQHTHNWIEEGIARIDSVMSGEAASKEWDRDDWGAKLIPNEVEIYSLHDDSYSEVVEISTFRQALLAWKEFIQAPADTNGVRKVEI